MKPTLVFDMDGVLVDVTESYRETIAQTVQHFTGETVSHERIQQYKNEGGWNDDWKLSHHIVTQAQENKREPSSPPWRKYGPDEFKGFLRVLSASSASPR